MNDDRSWGTLQIDLDAPVDAHGVVDGREVARALLRTAVRGLAPYVGNCPACVDLVYTALSNEVLEEMHRDKEDGGAIEELRWHGSGDDDEAARGAAFARHAEAGQAETDRLRALGREYVEDPHGGDGHGE